jgi:hypothetical protein
MKTLVVLSQVDDLAEFYSVTACHHARAWHVEAAEEHEAIQEGPWMIAYLNQELALILMNFQAQ